MTTNLEEQLKEQGKLVLDMIEKKRSNAVVYKMMEVYEDLYSQLKCPSSNRIMIIFISTGNIWDIWREIK
jgi:hypothetical protein